jgi:PIN domain nuclease of toxin-antitoxin system
VGRHLRTVAGSKLTKPADLQDYQGLLLLDTHIWLWYLDGDVSRLSMSAQRLLDRCGRAARLVVSDISFWEISVKAAKGKLKLSMDSSLWLARAQTAPGISFIPLDRDVLLLSTRLSGSAHNDPVDRMLLATAQLNNLPLVTADKQIIDFARSHAGTPVVDARR